tara:strand:+ start:466 stop:651 length:186 start_codon:yes stop_codon:yes gene_type:complete
MAEGDTFKFSRMSTDHRTGASPKYSRTIGVETKVKRDALNLRLLLFFFMALRIGVAMFIIL